MAKLKHTTEVRLDDYGFQVYETITMDGDNVRENKVKLDRYGKTIAIGLETRTLGLNPDQSLVLHFSTEAIEKLHGALGKLLAEKK